MEIFHTSWKDLFKNTDITMHSSTSLGNAKVVKNCSLIFFFLTQTRKFYRKLTVITWQQQICSLADLYHNRMIQKAKIVSPYLTCTYCKNKF